MVPPITVSIFPINGDGSTETADYIQELTAQDFKDIETFFAANAKTMISLLENLSLQTLAQR